MKDAYSRMAFGIIAGVGLGAALGAILENIPIGAAQFRRTTIRKVNCIARNAFGSATNENPAGSRLRGFESIAM